MISIVNYTKEKVSPALVRRVLEKAWQVLKFKGAIPEVSVAFVSLVEIRKLNRTWRKKDKVTDVLSFGSLKKPSKKIPADLGEIVICIAHAKEQAKDLGHSFKKEIAFLLTHGFLHLLGYDHERSLKEDKLMRDLQDKIVDTLNI